MRIDIPVLCDDDIPLPLRRRRFLLECLQERGELRNNLLLLFPLRFVSLCRLPVFVSARQVFAG